MKPLLRLSRIIDAVNSFIGRLSTWLVLAMVLIGAFNAVARYLGRFTGTNLSSNAYIEMQWYLFSIVFLAAGAWALQQDAHVRVDVLFGRLSPKRQALVNLVGTLIFLLPFCVLMIWVSWSYVENSWSIREVSPDPGGLPRYPIKFLIPFAFVLMLLQAISQAIKHAAEAFGLASETAEAA